MIAAGIGGFRESLYGYSRSQELDDAQSIQLISGTEGREHKMRTSHQSMGMLLDDL